MMPDSVERCVGSHLRERRMISESGPRFPDYIMHKSTMCESRDGKSRDGKSRDGKRQGKRDPG
jgi:hypothetical protein